MAFIKVLLFAAFAIASSFAAEAEKEDNSLDLVSLAGQAKTLYEGARTIFFDGGSTDAIGITDVFLYIGTFVLATITALAILGLIYSKSEDTAATGTGYAAPTATGGYAAYEQAYSVARSLGSAYQKYQDNKAAI